MSQPEEISCYLFSTYVKTVEYNFGLPNEVFFCLKRVKQQVYAKFPISNIRIFFSSN